MNSEFWHARFTQQALWTESTRKYLFNKAGISSNSKILEVGSGTGAILSTLLQPNLIGLDISNNHLEYAKSINSNHILVQADAYNCPFPDNYFDIVYFHYFLLWVKDPLRILSELTRVLRKGGSIIACAEPDYSGRIDYPESLKTIGDLQNLALIEQGADPYIGKKLPHLFSSSGFTISEFGVINGRWSTQINSNDTELEWKVIEKDLEGYMSSSELKKYKKLENEAISNNSFVRFIPTFYLHATKD
jgi:SAM-dependent methyltransferase